MAMNNSSVDAYLQDGCGRCEKHQTPQCKVHLWTPVLRSLRARLLSSGLAETMKWGQPCYTLDGANVVMLASLMDSCALSFFKGAALADPEALLVSPGPNSRFARYLKLRSVEELQRHAAAIDALLVQAIELERAGIRVEAPPASEPVPAELSSRLAADAELSAAFEALTPGRRRSHILHVSGAKQTETRARRVEKCVPEILAGRGVNERLPRA